MERIVSRNCDVCVTGAVVRADAVDGAAFVVPFAVPYKRRDPVCLTAEYCPGRFDIAVVFERKELTLSLLANPAEAVVGLAALPSIELLRLIKC